MLSFGNRNKLMMKPELANYIKESLNKSFNNSLNKFTPLNNYNGTPFWRLNRDLRATLPIDQLKGKPQVADCPILNVHRCKEGYSNNKSYNPSDDSNSNNIYFLLPFVSLLSFLAGYNFRRLQF
jgi:hypothetical protein